MAISKILHMKDSGNSFHARHLKRALDYVMNPEKTQGGRLVGAINCQADMAFEQMMDTKKQFGKTDKRQGYHIILSFKEDEVEPDSHNLQNTARCISTVEADDIFFDRSTVIILLCLIDLFL